LPFYFMSLSKAITLPILIILLLFLSACTASFSAIDESGLQPHLNVDLQIPKQLSTSTTGRFSITIQHQDGMPAPAERVMFEIWPEGRQDERISIPGTAIGEGQYAIDHQLMEQGIYVVQCFVSSGDYEVMPAKRFAIGEEAVHQLAALEAEETSDEPVVNGGHH
jgi:hypothetical protein